MEFIAEIFSIVFMEFILNYPGAVARWLYFKLIGKPQKFKTLVKDNPLLNGLFSIIIIIALVFISIGIFSN